MPVGIFRSNSNGASGNTFDAQGRLYTCESHLRRVTRADKKGKVEVIAEKYQGKRLNAPNDIVVRKDGQIYFTDPAFGNQEDSRELDFFGVYHISRRGELDLVAKPKGRPNGIALSPNGNILYVTNSDERNIRATTAIATAPHPTNASSSPTLKECRTACGSTRRAISMWPRASSKPTRPKVNRSDRCRWPKLLQLRLRRRRPRIAVRHRAHLRWHRLRLNVKECATLKEDSRRYPSRPFLGVGALIFENGKLLIVERAGEPFKGYWSLPGGILECGEKLDQGVRREVLEETGLEVDPLCVFEIF